LNAIVKEFSYGAQQIRLETGRIARQANGAVLASMGDTSVLVTVVARRESSDRDFFPLTVDYEERTYAAAMVGASAALTISGVPFSGPIGANRVGFVEGEYVLNPSATQLVDSRLNLVVAGTKNAVLMVESEAAELDEAQMLGAVMFGHDAMQPAIAAITEMAGEVGNERWHWEAPAADEGVHSRVESLIGGNVIEAYQIGDKVARQDKMTEIRQSAIDQLCADDAGDSPDAVKASIKAVEKNVVRGRILAKEPRIDGRDLETVRPITIETGIFPRTHGSALFTRGETQAIVVTTLGTERDAQRIDAIEGERMDAFMLHYNFPPYCVGETGRVGSPKRREIGHGRLAKRGLLAVLPDPEDFPYIIRIVSEITESNGSSSMATVCGTSLSLMDAGVKIKAPVAGVAMGLIKEADDFAILTDILGDEDHLGDMDFKVAGTREGVTALQMDIKIEGINREIMEQALNQARRGRLHILDEMDRALPAPRAEMSDYAPRITTIRIPTDKIRDIIGKGGVTIRGIQESTGATIDINDDGTVTIATSDNAAAEAARKKIEQITADVEEGTIYEGRVVRLMDFGAFVNILPGKDGLVHISQISNERVNEVSDVLSEGDVVKVKVLEVDKQGRVRLSMKAVNSDE